MRRRVALIGQAESASKASHGQRSPPRGLSPLSPGALAARQAARRAGLRKCGDGWRGAVPIEPRALLESVVVDEAGGRLHLVRERLEVDRRRRDAPLLVVVAVGQVAA